MKVLALLILSLFLSTAEANACSCAFGGEVLCQAYWEASAVFVGTVSYSSLGTIAEGERNPRQQRLVRFTIDQVFRGIEGTEAEVITGLGDSDCGYGFRLGGRYLVYAYRDEDKMLHTSICTRTKAFSEATKDIASINALAKAAPGSTIFGEVKRIGQDTQSERFSAVKKAKIIIESPSKRVEVTTDREGQYRVSGLPADTYRVRIELPEGLSIHNPERKAKISSRGCAHVGFWVEADTRVTGKVVDSQGQPAFDVLLELVPVRSTDNHGFPVYVRTDKEGRYEMKLVKPGRYRLGVRVYGSAGSTYVPFPRTYYPGVSDESQAFVFSITEGQRIDAEDLVLPPRLVERTLNGIVVGADGNPVKGATVWLKEREYSDADMPYRKETDDEGHFSFKVYEGFKYNLNAYIDTEEKGEQRRSESVEVRISEKTELIKLVLASPK